MLARSRPDADQLARDHLPAALRLGRAAAFRYRACPEEGESIALVALMDSIAAFDPERGDRFTALLSTVVYRAVGQEAARDARRQAREWRQVRPEVAPDHSGDVIDLVAAHQIAARRQALAATPSPRPKPQPKVEVQRRKDAGRRRPLSRGPLQAADRVLELLADRPDGVTVAHAAATLSLSTSAVSTALVGLRSRRLATSTTLSGWEKLWRLVPRAET
jgi:hypothetical protein